MITHEACYDVIRFARHKYRSTNIVRKIRPFYISYDGRLYEAKNRKRNTTKSETGDKKSICGWRRGEGEKKRDDFVVISISIKENFTSYCQLQLRLRPSTPSFSFFISLSLTSCDCFTRVKVC